MSPFARANTIVLWDTFDCPIIRNTNFTEVFLITRSALEEKGIYGNLICGLKFRAFVGNPVEYPGFTVIWLDDTMGKETRLSIIITTLLAQANRESHQFWLNLMLVVGDISEHVEFKRAIRFLNSKSKFNVLLAQPPQNASSSSSSGEVIDKEWLCSRLSAGEALMNMLGIGKTPKEEKPPSLYQIPKPLPLNQEVPKEEVAKVPAAMPKDDYTLCPWF